MRKSQSLGHQNGIVARKQGLDRVGVPSLEAYVLQAVDNEKISTLITSHKAAGTSVNNPIGTQHCHCQTAVRAVFFFIFINQDYYYHKGKYFPNTCWTFVLTFIDT